MTVSIRLSVRRFALMMSAIALLAFWPTAADAQSTPTNISLKQWDIFAATGGGSTATQNLASILLDASGIAGGTAGSVWVGGQNPKPRFGRLDPASSSNNYIEWRPVTSEAGGAPLGLALNKSNGDIWMGVQGDPSFVMKLGGTNTFRKFRVAYPLSPHGMTVASDLAAIAALPFKNALGVGDAIAKIPRNPTSGYVTISYWQVGNEPHYVALDSSGNIWFTAKQGNTVSRLNPASGAISDWTLPAGTAPAGVYVSGTKVCVASEGAFGALTGVLHCLNTTNNQMTQYARAPGDGFDVAERIFLNLDGEIFTTETNGNAVSFVAYAAVSVAPTSTVTPTTRTVLAKTYRMTVTDTTVTPTTYTIAPTTTSVAGTDNGSGYVRFALPTASLTYPYAQTGYPQPMGMTPVVSDLGRNTGAVYVAEYFDGGFAGRQPAARVDRVELTAAPPVVKTIVLNPNSLQFDAVISGTTPGSQAVAITEATGLTLNWSAAKTQSWLTLSAATGTAPSSLSASVNLTGLAAGTYTDTITVSDTGNTAAAKTIAVTLTVTAAPTLARSPATLSFTGTAGDGSGTLPAEQTISITNTGGGTLSWTASANQSWVVLRSTSGTAPASLNVTINPAGLSAGTSTATVTITSTGVTGSPQTVGITAVMTNGPVIALSPASMTFNATAGSAAPAGQTLTITNSGNVTLSWTAGSTDTWLSASPSSGTSASGGGTSTTTVSINHTGLTRGTYNGTLLVEGQDATNTPQSYPVTLNVKGPVISVSNVSVTAVRTIATANQTTTITNTGDATLNYTATVTSGTWLSIAAGATGTAAANNGTATLTLAFATTGLAKGIYTGTVSVADPNAGNSPQTITVTLTVTGPTISLSVGSLTFSGTRFTTCNAVLVGTNPGTQTFTVSNTGDATLSFTVATSTNAGGAWLSASPASGTIAVNGAPVTITVTSVLNPASVALPAGSYTGDVSVSSTTADNSPQSVSPVTLSATSTAAPRICVTPTSLNFGTVARSTTSAGQTFSLDNVGDSAYAWTSTKAASTGTVNQSPTSGTVNPGVATTVTVSVTTTNNSGNKTGNVTINSVTAGVVGSGTQVTLAWVVP